MAIEKRFIHFKKFSDFNSKKLSANEANTQYTVGVSGAIQNGAPDILYQSYVWIKDTKQQWTHGQLYDGTNLNEAGFLAGEETSDQLDDVETHTYVKYVPQTLTDEQKAQTRINIDAISGSSLKTINGESIVGSGDIEISGGSEDIRYFTEFTLEDFIEACESGDTVTYDTTELFNAMKNNKVICVPYRGYDKGFMVASYKSDENVEYPDMYLQKGGVEYYACTGDHHELCGVYPTYNSTKVVEMAGGEVIIECMDNHIYHIIDPVDYLFPINGIVQKGITINFMSGEFGTTLEMNDVYWLNGNIPQIEPNTCYELSLIQNTDHGYNAVLTPFKPAE